MARIGLIANLEDRLGYSKMVNYRLVQSILMNRNWKLVNKKLVSYDEYLGLAKHGWTIRTGMLAYGTYLYDEEVFYVNVWKKVARIVDVLELDAARGPVKLDWTIGICFHCYTEKQSVDTGECQKVLIKKYGEEIRLGWLNDSYNIFDLLSQIISNVRGFVDLPNPFLELIE